MLRGALIDGNANTSPDRSKNYRQQDQSACAAIDAIVPSLTGPAQSLLLPDRPAYARPGGNIER
ncbi:MAG: hypothetical protein J7463_11485 [Roseiflexus sp.]|nr:hypothetical protein [Roseiflexus sp.]MBO9335218.1 hypothetical protein [Roseiflexus sp.]MBO9366240.1 hypothetical protein [Roseiflexus sp.]